MKNREFYESSITFTRSNLISRFSSCSRLFPFAPVLTGIITGQFFRNFALNFVLGGMVITAAAKPKRIQLGRAITVTRCDDPGRPVFVGRRHDHDGRRQRISRSTEEADAIRTRLRQGQSVDVTLS